MRLPKLNIETGTAFIYLVVSGLWIWLSDFVLVLYVRDLELLTRIQTAKGWVFVITTSIMLYLVLKGYMFRHRLLDAERMRTESRLRESEERLRRAYEATIEGWSLAMDLHDKEIVGHTRRVTELTIALARKMKISEEELLHIRHGSLLHDIGKMGIPDEILRKPEQLSAEERDIMEKHPMYAFEMLQSISYLDRALEIPLLHHERWDGSGYPFGYREEQIPISARIFAVVDVYDALTSNRPYRTALAKKDAAAYIQSQSGMHFDPEIVRMFLEFIQHWEKGRYSE